MSSDDDVHASDNLLTVESQANIDSQSVDKERVPETNEMENETTTSTAKRKPVPRSKAWKSFKKVKISVTNPSGVTRTEERAKCNFCDVLLSCDSKSIGTSGLLYHVKHCKKNPTNRKRQNTILTFTAETNEDNDTSTGVLRNWSFDQEKVRKALAHMIITDELPFRFVERAGFKHFMRVSCPLFSIPSRWTMARDCVGHRTCFSVD